MPLVLWTTERRDGKSAKRGGASQGLRAELFRGMVAVLVKERAKVREMKLSLLKGAARAVLKESVVIN